MNEFIYKLGRFAFVTFFGMLLALARRAFEREIRQFVQFD